MLTVGRKRKSQTCLPYCDKKGCYDETIEVNIPIGKTTKKYVVWASRCKTLMKISQEALGAVNKLIN